MRSARHETESATTLWILLKVQDLTIQNWRWFQHLRSKKQFSAAVRVFGKSVLLLLACLVLGAALTSCVPSQGCTSAGVAGAECTFTGPEMLNARFEVVGQSPLHQSATIWMSSGEELVSLWDTFTYYVTVGPETCDFANFTT